MSKGALGASEVSLERFYGQKSIFGHFPILLLFVDRETAMLSSRERRRAHIPIEVADFKILSLFTSVTYDHSFFYLLQENYRNDHIVTVVSSRY